MLHWFELSLPQFSEQPQQGSMCIQASAMQHLSKAGFILKIGLKASVLQPLYDALLAISPQVPGHSTKHRSADLKT